MKEKQKKMVKKTTTGTQPTNLTFIRDLIKKNFIRKSGLLLCVTF